MDIDYGKYDREELESALNSIDREKHPENYRRATEAYERLRAQGPTAQDVPAGASGPVPIYKNFWRRLGANLLDGLILMPFALAPYWIFKADLGAGLAYYVLLIAGSCWYQVWFYARYGATPGKMAVGLKLMTVDLRKIGWDHALRRSAPSIALAITGAGLQIANILAHREGIHEMNYMTFNLMLSSGSVKSHSVLMQLWTWSELFTMLFNPKRRAIHDFIGGTVVVRWERP
jgi:uncharacterized RDD family membrane protein YckC